MKTNWWVLILFLAGRLDAQTIIAQPTNQIVFSGSNTTFSVSVSGIGPFTYNWQFNGTNLPPSGVLITTIAGNGTNFFSGDGGFATNASLSSPRSVAVDFKGNLFVVDADHNRVRQIGTNGIITTVAGNGTAGFSGDGGAATNAELNSPTGVALDANGNLFVVDFYNYRIRKIDTNGIIMTVAGNGTYDQYFFPGNGGLATNAALSFPTSVAVDAVGNIFITDVMNYCVRKVNTNGIISIIAGRGNNGIHSSSGDGGFATNATLFPFDLATDLGGNLFISDNNNQCIRKVDTNGIITTIANNGVLGSPEGIAFDARDNLFIADYLHHCVIEDSNGIFTTVAGRNGYAGYSGDDGIATNALLYEPEGVTADAWGNLFIADTGNSRIRKVQFNTPSLTLNNVSTNNAGSYSVVITGPSGSVTSSVVTLTVVITPTITSQPQPQTATNGHSASFAVIANGLPSLAYQWQFNGTNLFGATNTTLIFQNVFPANSGAYTVAITNAYGSITSNPAMLSVLPLGITSPKLLASGQFQFGFDTAAGVNYSVEYSTNLSQWFPMLILGGVGSPISVIDPNAADNPRRFYRIGLSPQ